MHEFFIELIKASRSEIESLSSFVISIISSGSFLFEFFKTLLILGGEGLDLSMGLNVQPVATPIPISATNETK